MIKTTQTKTKSNKRSFRAENMTSSAQYSVWAGQNEFPFTLKQDHLPKQS